MFGSIGGPEMIVILVIALLVLGPRKLPDLARGVGKGLRELRRASEDFRDTLDREVREAEQPRPSPEPRSLPEPASTAAESPSETPAAGPRDAAAPEA
jgi:Tat protein translocase TatB subunit